MTFPKAPAGRLCFSAPTETLSCSAIPLRTPRIFSEPATRTSWWDSVRGVVVRLPNPASYAGSGTNHQ